MKRVPAGYDPCTEAYVTKYFNRGDVQRALHANRTGLPYPYSPCRSASTPQLLFLFSLHTVYTASARRAIHGARVHVHPPITLPSATTGPLPLRSGQLACARIDSVRRTPRSPAGMKPEHRVFLCCVRRRQRPL